jgi:hypothetical protein
MDENRIPKMEPSCGSRRKPEKMTDSPLDSEQILVVDNGPKQYNLRRTAVTVVQTPVLCKTVWLTSRCSHFNAGGKPSSRSCEWFAVEKWFKITDEKNEVQRRSCRNRIVSLVHVYWEKIMTSFSLILAAHKIEKKKKCKK